MMKRDTYNIVKVARLLSLVVLMAFGAGLKGWGQIDLPNSQNQYYTYLDFCYNRPSNNIVQNTDKPGFSEVDEILYVMPGDEVDIALQFYNVTENLNGYVRWYLEGQSEGDGTTQYLSRETSGNLGLVQYKNGYAWFRYSSSNYTNLSISDKNYVTPSQICYITYTCPEDYEDSDQHVVVCEASSLTNFDDPITGFNNTKDTRMAPTLSIRKRYIIKSAATIQKQLNEYRENIEKIEDLGSKWLAVDGYNVNNTKLPADIISNPSNYFKEVYTIHTPIWSEGKGTTYRLEEQMSSYYVGTSKESVAEVRWRTYDEKGTYIGTSRKLVPTLNHAQSENENWANLFNHKFDLSEEDLTVTHTRYITAEVRNSDGDWYPVSFQKILLEPNIVPKTQEELKKDNSYVNQRRLDSFLADPNRFELLHTISFDQSVISFSELSEENNVAENPYSADTYYAFAYPSRSGERASSSKTAGRGEYGLYRTLNYDEISRPSNGYVDYFMNRYRHYAVDRTYEISEGKEIGHFLFVDAADEPGVIAKVDLDPGTVLCTSTSLIVTAWVCNLLHFENNPIGADIGITFKGIEADGTEVILDKYYSGELGRKPEDKGLNTNPMTQAQWQQVYFNFTTDVQYDRYKVEISNNSRGSNGADYAIDDIRVYRSLPAIDVSRLDACESSQLYVSSDYQTILNNMGWDLDDNVINKTGVDITDFNTRKYRYGFLSNEIILKNENVGNVYFSVLDGDKYDDQNNPTIEWIVVNKKLVDETNPNVANLAYTIRAVVPTNIDASSFPKFPETKDDALLLEIEANIQAMEDFNNDFDNLFSGINNVPKNLVKIQLDNLSGKGGDAILNSQDLYEEYELRVKEFYSQLEIPRIHIPWASEADRTAGMIYLTSIDVDNTDMRFVGEQDVEGNEASGHYKVYLFSAAEIVKSQDVVGFQPHPERSCALVSDFYVLPSIVIKVDTESQTGDVSCLGEVHHVTAKLVQPDLDENGYETGNLIEVTDVNYNFDWYLGSLEEYDALNPDGRDLKTIIYDLRSKSDDPNIINGSGSITSEVVESSSLSVDEKGILLALLAPPSKLRTGKAINFQLVDEIVAMPYVDNSGSEDTKRLYCTELQAVKLEANANVPELSPGFPNVDYAAVQLTNVPLRIGLRHIQQNEKLSNVPIQKKIILGVDEATTNVLKKMTGNTDILLEVNGNYQTVATLEDLFAENDGEKNFMTFTFSRNAAQYFEEGQKYDLLVPFGEFASKDANTPIAGSCEGYAILTIKIVPEYLTWQGTTGAEVWYNDGNWHQSTEEELYMNDKTSDQDANGDDVITNAFAPLYFTKITINPKQENDVVTADQLKLLKEEKTIYTITSNETTNTYELLNFGSDGMNISLKTTSNIEYDMAVDTIKNGIKVVPYYGNKVEQIYFKPEALLKNQQYLDYQKAWVEFEMEKNAKYWMASPLQDVFAGDMYAPQGTARQTTPAFTDITYNGNEYNRWNPAFYQKAWDKGITYYDNPQVAGGGYTPNFVSVVHSNWSIEYNNVDVPYALGKGFYASVEDFNNNAGENGEAVALVRLPKADASYQYVTKAASTIAKRPNSGQLAKGDVTIILADKDDTNTWGVDQGGNHIYYADGDGEHFLIGNPYMYPLDIQKFFSGNLKEGTTTNESIFEPKYWTLQDGTPTATVGTPDVSWETTGSTTLGQIAPMQAFFVELKEPLTGDAKLEVKFTTSMMAEQATTKSMDTKSYSATNPTLTITAERGETKSVAKLVTSDKADNGYEASEDAVVLLDSELDAAMVYTVSGSRAAQVNAMKEISNVGLGIYNENDDEATVTISGLSQMASPLYLYDAQTRKSVELSGDSYTMQITGDSHGRYYLRNSAMADELENSISIYSAQRGQVIVSALQPVKDIKVFNVSGALVRQFSVNTTQYTFPIQSGLYIIYASDGEQEHTEKVIVR